MSLFQDLSPLLMCFRHIRQQFKMLSDTLLVQAAMLSSSCSSSDSDTCQDDTEALTLKLIAIGSILVAGVTGVCIPLVGKSSRHLSNDSHLFVATKAFAAGVILATGFVHMLPDGSDNLTSSCLPTHPWSDFPFAGFIAMCSALVTLMADFVGTQMYGSKGADGKEAAAMDVPILERVHIVGAYAHADHHVHRTGGVDHGDGNGDEDKGGDGGYGHSHLPHFGGGDREGSGRHAVVSQVLEMGIVSHSVIIGLSIGVSHSPCTIRPLVAALSFHQFFEGFALGGCISEANFKPLKTVMMASFFAITTPSGIAAGIGLASFYDADSSGALIVEGILDSISAGILIYMSLVDLIAADFMSTKMRCNLRLQIASYAALFLGAALMSSLAVWS